MMMMNDAHKPPNVWKHLKNMFENNKRSLSLSLSLTHTHSLSLSVYFEMTFKIHLYVYYNTKQIITRRSAQLIQGGAQHGNTEST
jgi:hypothetical protein